jgi:hypothetical protein
MKQFYTILFFLTTSIMLGQSNYLVDNFDYTAGQALTENGWTAHSAGTTNPILVSNGGLTWSGYIGSAVGNAALVTNTGQDVNKRFGADISSGTVYASFLMNVTAKTSLGFFFHLGYYSNTTTPVLTALSTSFRARTYVNQGTNPDTQFKLGLAFNATTTQGETGDLNIGETYLVVVKYAFIDGENNDEVSLYVFPQGATITSEPATPDLGPFTNTTTTATPTPDAPVLQNVAFRQYDAIQNVTMDGIYVRTEWNLVDAGTALSTDDFALSQISLYPNPVNNGILNIISPSNELKEISVFDVSGRLVLKTKTENNSIDVSQLKSGLYLLNISSNGSKKISKIIIN